MISRQQWVFSLTGLIAAATNFGSRIVFNQYLDFSAAILLAYLAAMLLALLLRIVCKYPLRSGSWLATVTKISLFNALALVQIWLVSIGMLEYLLPWLERSYQLLSRLDLNSYLPEISHATGILVPVITAFLVRKLCLLRGIIKPFLSKQFVAFLLTGGTAAAVNFGSRIVYNQWLDFSAAVIVAYITGMITAFILAKLFVFKESKQSLHKSATFFILVNLVAVAQTWGVSMGLAYYLLPFLGVKVFVHEISHLVGVIVPVFTSYLGHKRWSFKTAD